MKTYSKWTVLLVVICMFVSVGPTMAEAENTTNRAVLFSSPILMTSAGQSADVQMLYAIASRSGVVDAEVRSLIDAKDFNPEAIGTLAIAVGGSSKGLGAAGIDTNEEIERVTAILKKGKGKLPIIVAHLGGEGRRGELSDRFIRLVLPYADYILVVEGGDGNDHLFSKTAQELGIPIDFVENIAEVGNIFSAKFGLSKDVN